MDRIIKFRAYIKKDYHKELIGKILEVSSIHLKKNKVIIGYSLSRSNYGNHSFNYEDIELMQFIGLYDKNGKEIYEGDILQIDVDRAYVKWNDRYGYFQLIPIGDYYFDSDVIGQALEYLEAEVIGNIYDNKNLLEDE